MLSYIFRRSSQTALRTLLRSSAHIVTAKHIAEKKKQLYQVRSQEGPGRSGAEAEVVERQRKEREREFQSMLFEFGKELHQYFTHKMGSSAATINIESILAQNRKKVLQNFTQLNYLELLNYVEIVKNLCLHRLEHMETIEVAYRELQKMVDMKGHREVVQKQVQGLWAEEVPFQIRIRSVCLVEYVGEEGRQAYFRQIVPWVRYFKRADILILLFEKWGRGYEYGYELLDQIHSNQSFRGMDEVRECYIKMLFLRSIRGRFLPGEDGIFNSLLSSFQARGNILLHSTFDKFLKILHLQGSLVQTESTRFQIENSLNFFINVAKSQNYDHSHIRLDQLVDIYLNFEETKSTGEILLNQITYLANLHQFQLTPDNFPTYRKLLFEVLNNIEHKLKYELLDYLNKEYTMDTVSFLRSFLPKYIALWPEVILQVNDAFHQLFPSPESCPLLQSFQEEFRKIVDGNAEKITIHNLDFTLKVLKFSKLYEKRGNFSIDEPIITKLLRELLDQNKQNQPSNEHLQMFYYILKILDKRCGQAAFRGLVEEMNSSIVEREMERELECDHESSPVTSLDDNIIWLSLCSAQVKAQRLPINTSVVEIFVNKKLFFMLNSLKYEQVFEILAFTVGLHRLATAVYERLLRNLSTFIVYVSGHHRADNSRSSFFLNQRYRELFVPICRLVLGNRDVFRRVADKQAFKVFQIMMIKAQQEEFQNQDMLALLDILGDPEVLSISIHRQLENMKFTMEELEGWEQPERLKCFLYYNQSLLRYFEGKYNESQIRKKLALKALSHADIEECFSKVEIYKTIITDGQLNIHFEMPAPETANIEFKYMYICQKIYQKIANRQKFDLDGQFLFFEQWEQEVSLPKVDLSEELRYIQEELLLDRSVDNEFRLQERQLPRYIKMEVWKSYLFCDKRLSVDAKDLFLNTKQLVDEILVKVVKGIQGKAQKVREVIRQFSCDDQIITQLQDAQLRFEQHGAALEFRREEGDQDRPSLTFLCASNTNYKVLYICAYLLSRQGYKVGIIREGQPIDPFISHLQLAFRQPEGEATQKEEDISE